MTFAGEEKDLGKVILIDEEYGTFGGHHAAYDLPICDELRRRRVPFCLLTDHRLETSEETVQYVIPTFHTSAALRLQSRYVPRLINRAVAALVGNVITTWDLIRAVTPRVSSGDVIILCRPLSRTRIAYGIWLRYLALRSRLVTITYVVHNEPEPLFRIQMRTLQRLARGHRLEFVAHSSAIAKLIHERLGIESAVVPLPFKSAPFVSRRRIQGEPVRFAFLGLGHRTKGLDLVVTALENSADLLATGRVQVAIQCYLPFVDPASEALHRQTRELQTRFVGIEILDRELGSSEYLRQLQLADFILLPHRLETYRFALSGVFADAMSAGRPVVVAEGSYMSEIIHQTGAGVTFESGSAESLQRAIREATECVDVLLERARAVRERWDTEQGPEAFVSGLSRLWSSANRRHSAMQP